MKSNKFLFLSLFFFLGICLGYFYIIDSIAIYERQIPRSYKQFLLKNSTHYQKKIILIGGSDVHHGIDALEIEKFFNVPVINIGDNGGYPLRHKIYNVQEYVQPNDIVIFSLPWLHYFDDGRLTDDYVRSVVDNYATNSFFYRTLPLLEKVKFVFSDIPYKKAIAAAFTRPNIIEKINYQHKSINMFRGKVSSQGGDARGGTLRDGPEDVEDDGSRVLSCDEYVFYPFYSSVIRRYFEEGSIRISAYEISELERGHKNVFRGIMNRVEKRGFEVNLKMQLHLKPFGRI